MKTAFILLLLIIAVSCQVDIYANTNVTLSFIGNGTRKSIDIIPPFAGIWFETHAYRKGVWADSNGNFTFTLFITQPTQTTYQIKETMAANLFNLVVRS